MASQRSHPVVAAPADTSDASEPVGPSRRTPWATTLRLVAAPLLASVVLVAVNASRMDAPFSPAFPSFNTAVWSTGSQAVREHGWWASRLGAMTEPASGEVGYAHHPPLTRIEVGVAEQVLGEHRWVDRLPALLSSLAAIWLCWAWLGACRFRLGSRSLGVLAVGGSGAMLTYGAMLNMEAVWMPVAFALLWAWQRAERRGGGGWSCFLLGVLGCTAAHQGILLVGALGVLGVVHARTQRRRLRPHESAVVAATVVGAALFALWAWWGSGDLGDLVRIARERSGAQFGWIDFVRSQVEHGVLLFGIVPLLCLVAGPLLVRDRPDLRGPLAAVWSVGLAYAVVFRQGATIHPYWNVALLPAVALGGALLGDQLARHGRRAVAAGLVACAAFLVIAGVAAQREAHLGDGAGEVARVAGARDDGTFYSTELVADWVRYESGRPVEPVYTCDAVVELAAARPDAEVLTSRYWSGWGSVDDWQRFRTGPDAEVRDDYSLAPAAVLRDAACAAG